MPGALEKGNVGFLYVFSEPNHSLPIEEFHDWYDNEHGPLRMRLPYISNGYRYKAIDNITPTWLAVYDIDDLEELKSTSYTKLRQNRSIREGKIVNKGLEVLDRQILQLYSSKGSSPSPSPVVVCVSMLVDAEDVDELDRWYEEEHIDLLAQVPGWRRSRRYRRIDENSPSTGQIELVSVHEYDSNNGLGGPEHDRARSTPWRTKALKLVKAHYRRSFELFHEFVTEPPAPGQNGAIIKSHFIHDGFKCHYSLDGSRQPQSPVIVFLNSILTNYHIWDATVVLLSRKFPDYRFLRYNARGYNDKIDSGEPVRLEDLSDDLRKLLDELGIEKPYAVIGVSVGGATALQYAIKYPTQLERLIACDCNISSSEGNTKAWEERKQVARTEGISALANQTVERWFPETTRKSQPEVMSGMRKMINEASIEGFAQSVNALCDYDISAQLGDIQVPTLCVVGSEDAKLPTAMAGFVSKISEARLETINGAGHLPMVDNPAAFVDVIQGFL